MYFAKKLRLTEATGNGLLVCEDDNECADRKNSIFYLVENI